MCHCLSWIVRVSCYIRKLKGNKNWGSKLVIKTRVFLANFEHQGLDTTIPILAKFDHKGF